VQYEVFERTVDEVRLGKAVHVVLTVDETVCYLAVRLEARFTSAAVAVRGRLTIYTQKQ